MAFQYKAKAPVAAPEYKPLPAGKYKFKVIDAEEKKSKNSGNQMLEVVLRVNGDDGPKVWDYLVFTEKALWKVDQFFASIGTHPGEGKDMAFEATDVIGEGGEVELAIEKDDKGREVNKVVAYLSDEF